MKKLNLFLLLGLLLAFSNSMNAQGNLQFNQVINVEMTATPVPGPYPQYYVPIATQTLVVPPGKVFKMESVEAAVTRNTLLVVGEASLHTGNNGVPVVYVNDLMIYGNTNADSYHKWPQIRWFPAGTYVFSLWYARVNPAVTYSITSLVTGIEFNVVP